MAVNGTEVLAVLIECRGPRPTFERTSFRILFAWCWAPSVKRRTGRPVGILQR
jgi:hypothetical protein